MGCQCSKQKKNTRSTKYRVKKNPRKGNHLQGSYPNSVFNVSNSVEHEEVAMITHGFRPDFNNFEDTQRMSQQKPRTMRTMKKPRKSIKGKKGKRILKRVCYAATSQQSSYSSLISDYILDSGNELSVNSNYVESVIDDQFERDDQPSPIPEEEGEDEEENPFASEGSPVPNSSSSPEQQEYNSDYNPRDEDVNEDSSHRMLKHNSPQESFRVFNQ